MNTTQTSTASTADPVPSAVAERSVLMDLLAVAPSATLGRELFALFANLALVGILIAVFQPSTVVAAVMAGIVGLFMIGRLVAGLALRGYAGALRGER